MSRPKMALRNLQSNQFSTITTAVRTEIIRAQAVCFDVDSTVITEEGIDVLAGHCGVGDKVAAWTSRAMNGNVKFEDALSARLNLINPSRQAIEACLKCHPPTLSPGLRELVSSLHERGTAVYLVSGGFRLMIEPIAESLEIPIENIFANTILFHENGTYNNFAPDEFTSMDGGKRRALKTIKSDCGYSSMIMVGDGATDMQAKGDDAANICVGYGGIVARDIVREKADWFIHDFDEFTDIVRNGGALL